MIKRQLKNFYKYGYDMLSPSEQKFILDVFVNRLINRIAAVVYDNGVLKNKGESNDE